MLWFDKQHLTMPNDVVLGDKQPWVVIKLKLINNMTLNMFTHPSPQYGSVENKVLIKIFPLLYFVWGWLIDAHKVIKIILNTLKHLNRY